MTTATSPNHNGKLVLTATSRRDRLPLAVPRSGPPANPPGPPKPPALPPADGAQSAHGVPAGLRYAVEFHGKQLLTESALGMEIVGQPALGPGMHFTGAETSSADDTYTIPVGKTKTVRDHYNGLHAEFEDASGRRLAIEVRVFNDGIVFRYVVPQQPALGQVRIA